MLVYLTVYNFLPFICIFREERESQECVVNVLHAISCRIVENVIFARLYTAYFDILNDKIWFDAKELLM